MVGASALSIFGAVAQPAPIASEPPAASGGLGEAAAALPALIAAISAEDVLQVQSRRGGREVKAQS